MNYLLLENFNIGYNSNFFSILSIFSLLCAILVIISNNPIISVLYLIALFIIMSIYLLIVGFHFIALSYLLVYVGAISMLFLFILMLIDIRLSELHNDTNNSLLLAAIIIFIFYNIINNVLITQYNNIFYINNILNNVNYVSSISWESSLIEYYDIITLGSLLYTNYNMWLILSSFILLLAMVGAIIINIKK